MTNRQAILISIFFAIYGVLMIVLTNYIEEIEDANIKLEKRIFDLEKDYKIYELHLQELETNQDAHFAR